WGGSGVGERGGGAGGERVGACEPFTCEGRCGHVEAPCDHSRRDCPPCPPPCGDGSCDGPDDCDADCHVSYGGFCGDGICQENRGENLETCFEDCHKCPPVVCGPFPNCGSVFDGCNKIVFCPECPPAGCRDGICSPEELASGSCPEDCASSGVFTYTCQAKVADGYDNAAEGKQVVLEAWGQDDPGPGGAQLRLDRKSVGTDPSGAATVVMTLHEAAFELICRVENAAGEDLRTRVGGGVRALPSGTVVSLKAMVVPTATANVPIPGVHGDGVAHLYQGGAYDKVVVIPEGWDPHEQDDKERRNRDELWLQFKEAMRMFHSNGYDVWLVEP